MNEIRLRREEATKKAEEERKANQDKLDQLNQGHESNADADKNQEGSASNHENDEDTLSDSISVGAKSIELDNTFVAESDPKTSPTASASFGQVTSRFTFKPRQVIEVIEVPPSPPPSGPSSSTKKKHVGYASRVQVQVLM